jgi:hypothetical protein
MKSRFILFRRAGVFYAEETATGRQTSLRTKDEGEATRQPAMNLQIAQVYLQHADPTLAQRTWQDVMDATFPLKTGPTQARWQAANDYAQHNDYSEQDYNYVKHGFFSCGTLNQCRHL